MLRPLTGEGSSGDVSAPPRAGEIRYWYSVWGSPDPWDSYASGWCFGATPELALASAVADVQRWHPRVRRAHVTLQSDVRPYDADRPPATYHDFRDVVFAHGPS